MASSALKVMLRSYLLYMDCLNLANDTALCRFQSIIVLNDSICPLRV